MDPLLHLHQLWSWLPAFRAVAEAQHLPTAATRMGVSAPAMSRAIRLVEAQVGTPLFARERGRLVLNEAGHALLVALRDAMRLVDDGWDRATHAELRGVVRIAVGSSTVGQLLATALERVTGEHPGITPHLVQADPATLTARLLDGGVDLAIVEHPVSHAGLELERLPRVPMHVYCGPRSPLWKRAHPTRALVLEQPFVVPGPGASDGWPADVPRKVGVVSASLLLAVELCASGRWLAALPEPIERSAGRELRRLPMKPALPFVVPYLLSRAPARASDPRSRPGKIEVVLAALRAGPPAR